MSDPNSFDQEIQNAQSANSENPVEGTEPEKTGVNPVQEAELDIDYRKKFAESAKEAQRLYEENKRLKESTLAKGTEQATEELYPGFDNLDEETQRNLAAYTETIARRAKEEILKDPAISHAKSAYNESKFNSAFLKTIEKYPELKDSANDFKAKYYNPNLVPENIDSILEDVAKMYLFDKAKDIGAREEKAKAERVDMERATGGDKTPQARRSLEDWQRMSTENPQKFASLSKEFNADMESGKI
jgi:hypothetical protein